MRYLPLVCLFVSLNAFPDAQFDQLRQTMHVPYSAVDTDREFYVDNVMSAPVQNGADLHYIAEEERLALCFGSKLPEELRELAVGESVYVTRDDTGEQCTGVDANGTARTAGNWQARITVVSSCEKGVMVLRHRLWCANAQ